MNVLVSNGNIGSVVATSLAAQNHTVRLLVRKPTADAGRLTLAVADAANPDTLDAVFAGVDTFFFVSPLVENMVELAQNLIGAARKAGVTHIVRSSTRGASPDAPITMGKLHGQVEELVKQSGIPYTIVQPASFFQNTLANLATITTQDAFYGSAGEGQNALIDVRDIAAVVVKSITEPGHAGKTYTVTGSELLSNADVAAELTRQTGRTIRYIDQWRQQAYESLLQAGLSPWLATAYVELDEITRLGYVATATTDVASVTGTEPIKFRDFVRENLDLFQPAKAEAERGPIA
ncbi:SDR family oxidoreductase [Spirosoma arcticum]